MSDLNESQNPNPNITPPDPIGLEAYELVRSYFDNLDTLAKAAHAFEALLPKKKEAKSFYGERHFKNEFFGYPGLERVYRLQESLSPLGVALIALKEFFDSPRFIQFNPKDMPFYKKLMVLMPQDEPVWIPVNLGSNRFMVPDHNELWIHDFQLNSYFVVTYGIFGGNQVKIQIESAWNNSDQNQILLGHVKDAIVTSPYFRGQILELSGRGFTILDLPEQYFPVVDRTFQAELEKNVINVFKKADQFKAYGLPTKRAIILEGPPGNGKTMIARHLAYSLKGQVTVLWVTAKAIESASDIAQIFDMARKLSPVLVIMEDLDLISGSRTHDTECLGEMLSQLDGIAPNEALVLVASTNRVKSLDEALRDRPGRFDRIYTIGRPSPELADRIARQYLQERGIPDELIDRLSLATISKGDLTGAQIVEVVKGAIFEAIHRGCSVNEICLSVSYRGLMDQRKLVSDES